MQKWTDGWTNDVTKILRRPPYPHTPQRTFHLDLPVGLRVLQARVCLQLRQAPDRGLLVLRYLGWVRFLGIDPELCMFDVSVTW